MAAVCGSKAVCGCRGCVAEASSAGLYTYYINNIYSGTKKKNAAAEDVWAKCPPQVFIHIAYMIALIYIGRPKKKKCGCRGCVAEASSADRCTYYIYNIISIALIFYRCACI
jgi:hypothetical protein